MESDDDYEAHFSDSKTNIERLMKIKVEMFAEKEANADCLFTEYVTSKYKVLSKIGEGAFGEVFKARNRETRKVVALKRVRTDNWSEGFPHNAVREVKILQVVKHRNIIKLVEICSSSASMSYLPTYYLVFKFCKHDLFGLLSNPEVKFTIREIKKILKQLLNALYYLHTNLIVHRDLKPANILLTKRGKLKLADFGLARALQTNKPNLYTNTVVTLWYRPPEILLGETNYDSSIDLWAVGCIFIELFTKTAIMKGQSEIQQLTRISEFCGSITLETLPQAANLKLFSEINLPKNEKRKVKESLKGIVRDAHALNLIDAFLRINPKSRINCDKALDHRFFYTGPRPCKLKKRMKKHKKSMFQYFLKLEYSKRNNENPGATANE